MLAHLYIDANVYVDPVPPLADAERLILNTNDFPNGRITVPGRGVVELNNFLQQLPFIGYNTVSIEELCNHPARMLFGNLLEEEELLVTHWMRPLRKEIERIFYRLMTESPNEIEAFGYQNVQRIDMPYRSIKFVKTLWTRLGKVYENNANLVPYWRHLLEQEGRNVELELQFGAKEDFHGSELSTVEAEVFCTVCII